MSKIAEALAKAKERTGGTAAPFMGGAPILTAEAAAQKKASLRRARRRQRFRLILSAGALLATALILWLRFEDELRVKPVSTSGAESASEAPASAESPRRVEPVNQAPPTVILPSTEGGMAIEPRLTTQGEVDALVFSAVMPGERPRLMYRGRIVNVGERVAGELVFAGIHDGRLVFNDAQGAVYLRRY